AVADDDALRSQIADLTAERDALEAELENVTADRDRWQRDAQHWRSETARFVAAEERRIRWRLREARFRYSRRVGRALPASVQSQVTPLLLRATNRKSIGPEPLQPDEPPRGVVQKNEKPRKRRPTKPPAPRNLSRTRTRQPIDGPVSVVVPTWN